MLAKNFAISLDQEFRKRTRKKKAGEVFLFRQLQQSFSKLSGKFHIEEFHGTKNQVRFSGVGSWGRGNNARCELSDLLIVTFSKSPKLNIRLTFLQAKYENKKIINSLQTNFKANLEQWDLLSRRPDIVGLGNFNPPKNLLSGALLPSVGTFGFFYNTGKNYQMLYSIANNLKPLTNKYSQRSGRLGLICSCCCNPISFLPYRECQIATSIFDFAFCLYKGLIGTPIEHQVDGITLETRDIRNWLGNVLLSLISDPQIKKNETPVAKELLGLLDAKDTNDDMRSFGAKSLIVIKAGEES